MNKPSPKAITIFLTGAVVGVVFFFGTMPLTRVIQERLGLGITEECKLHDGFKLRDASEYYAQKVADARKAACSNQEFLDAVEVESTKRINKYREDTEESTRANQYKKTLSDEDLDENGLPKIPTGMHRSPLLYSPNTTKVFYFQGRPDWGRAVIQEDSFRHVLMPNGVYPHQDDDGSMNNWQAEDFGIGYVYDTGLKTLVPVINAGHPFSSRDDVGWLNNDQIITNIGGGDGGCYGQGFLRYDADKSIYESAQESPYQLDARNFFYISGCMGDDVFYIDDVKIEKDSMASNAQVEYNDQNTPIKITKNSSGIQRVLIPKKTPLLSFSANLDWNTLRTVLDTKKIKVRFTKGENDKLSEAGSFELDLDTLEVTNITPRGLLTEY